jgi:small subunit ribosomal protein S4
MISMQCKKCRRAGQKLFLKGDRCFTPKCSIVKRPYPPGIHGKRRSQVSEYGRQLREKQRVKNIYGILEKQFRNYVLEVRDKVGDKRELLYKKLEKRFDNVVFRSGLAKSRRQARQKISHNHFRVNGKRMNIPSYEVKAGDIIQVKEKSKASPLYSGLAEYLKKYQAPYWLSLDANKLEVKIVSDVSSEDLSDLPSFGMIIEFYSR